MGVDNSGFICGFNSKIIRTNLPPITVRSLKAYFLHSDVEERTLSLSHDFKHVYDWYIDNYAYISKIIRDVFSGKKLKQSVKPSRVALFDKGQKFTLEVKINPYKSNPNCVEFFAWEKLDTSLPQGDYYYVDLEYVDFDKNVFINDYLSLFDIRSLQRDDVTFDNIVRINEFIAKYGVAFFPGEYIGSGENSFYKNFINCWIDIWWILKILKRKHSQQILRTLKPLEGDQISSDRIEYYFSLVRITRILPVQLHPEESYILSRYSSLLQYILIQIFNANLKRCGFIKCRRYFIPDRTNEVYCCTTHRDRHNLYKYRKKHNLSS